VHTIASLVGLLFFLSPCVCFSLLLSLLSLPTQIVFRWKEAFSLYCLVESFFN
jgi:hypothetical protein